MLKSLPKTLVKQIKTKVSLSPSAFHKGISLLTNDNGIRVATETEIQNNDTLRGDIDSAISTLPVHQQEDIKAMLDYTQSFDRDDVYIEQMRQILGLSNQDVDDFFEMVKNEVWNN